MGSMHAGSNLALRVAEFNSIFNMPSSNYKAAPVNNEQNSVFNRLKEDIDRLETRTNQTKEHSHTDQALLYALSPLPPARRIGSLPDTMEEKNYPRAGLLLGMAAANFPGDLREMELAFKEGKNIFKKGLSAIEYNGQHQSRFFKNTFLEFLPEKYPWLMKIDKTLYGTKCGKFLRNLLKIEVDPSSIKSLGTKSLSGFEFSGNYFQRLAGRSLMRIPVLGLAASVVLETPAIIKSVTNTKGNILDKGKALGTQLIKSAGYIGFVNTAIAIGGATLLPCGYIAALVGMGIGSSLGLMASKTLNEKIDKVMV